MKTELTKAERISRLVLAVLVGTLIWGAAIDSEVFSVEVSFPLFLTPEENFTVSGISRDTVTVRLTGSGLEMLSYQIGSSPVRVDKAVQTASSSSFPATETIDLDASDVHFGGSVTVSQIAPDQVSFTVDTIISRKLPVAVLFSGATPSRFLLVSVEPEYITATGPSHLVSSLDSINTVPVELVSGDMTVSLALHDEMVAYSEGSVRIRVFVPSVPPAAAGRAGY
jgi:hypothetical protein